MTQLSPRTENFGPGDQSWLGSRHGVDNAVSITFDTTAGSAKIVDGYIKSGEPLALNTSTNKYQPYNSGGSNGTNVLAGFLVADIPVITFPGDTPSGDVIGAMLVHGFVRLSKLPSTVTATQVQNGTGLFVTFA